MTDATSNAHASSFATLYGHIAQDVDESTASNVQVDPQYQMMVVGMYLALLMDIVVVTCTDPVYSEQIVVHFVAFGFQLLTFFVTTMIFYMILSETFFIKKASYQRVMKEFNLFFWVAPVHFLLFLLVRMYKLGLLYSYYPHLAVWNHAAYYTLYCCHRIGGMVYWLVIMRSASFLLNDPKLYTYECMKR
mmetsp:Transcript_21520/g.41053  ORF Transcript_21520/g.41053 Transcript_21520/m.41053 type:complete len:190 (-) Transcript_21520:121-690(-)